MNRNTSGNNTAAPIWTVRGMVNPLDGWAVMEGERVIAIARRRDEAEEIAQAVNDKRGHDAPGPCRYAHCQEPGRRVEGAHGLLCDYHERLWHEEPLQPRPGPAGVGR